VPTDDGRDEPVFASSFASTLEVVRDLVDVEIVGNHDVVESVERVARYT
jgi:hypothetical protein